MTRSVAILPSGPLIGFRLEGQSYVRIPPSIGGGIPSEILGVELRLRGDGFGFYDVIFGEWLKTPAEKADAAFHEAAAALHEAAAARQAAEIRAQQAEEELTRLRAALTSQKNS